MSHNRDLEHVPPHKPRTPVRYPAPVSSGLYMDPVRILKHERFRTEVAETFATPPAFQNYTLSQNRLCTPLTHPDPDPPDL